MIVLLMGLSGCEGEPPAGRLVGTSVDDLDAPIPPTATIELTFSLPLDAADARSVLVIEGASDEAFLKDLRRSPLDARHLGRLASGRVTFEGTVARFTPARPLVPERLHTLVANLGVRLAGRPLAHPGTRPFTTGSAASGRAVLALADPPDGTVGVVRNLRQVDVTFSRPVRGVDASSLTLLDEGGRTVATRVASGGCAACYGLVLAEPLAARTAYQIIARPPIVDDEGQSPFAQAPPPAFTTGDLSRSASPELRAIDVVASNGCLVATWSTDVAASARLCASGRCVEDDTRRAWHTLGLPLARGMAGSFSIASWDESTVPVARRGPLPIPAASALPISITETLANPLGPRPAQQWVELHNEDGAPLEVRGLVLEDEGGESALPDAILPPSGYALVVPESYLPDDGVDVVPATGALLLRIGARQLGSRGLRLGGERLALRDRDGSLVSRFSTYAVTAAGQSVERVARCDLENSFRPTRARATPGGP